MEGSVCVYVKAAVLGVQGQLINTRIHESKAQEREGTEPATYPHPPPPRFLPSDSSNPPTPPPPSAARLN